PPSDGERQRQQVRRSDDSGLITTGIPARSNRPGAQLRVLNVTTGKVARLPILDVTMPSVVVQQQLGPNLLANSEFAGDPENWTLEITVNTARASARTLDEF